MANEPEKLDPEDTGRETWHPDIERLLDRHYGRLQADADIRQRELLTAIAGVTKAVAALDPAAAAALAEHLKTLGSRIDAIAAADQKITQS